MKSNDLSIAQRFIAVAIYLALFFLICWYFTNDLRVLLDTDSKYSFLLISCALLLLFGAYITEPYFTKPVDVVTNSIALFLALLSLNNPNEFVGYFFLLYFSVGLGASATILILLSQFSKCIRFQRFVFEIITTIGQSRWTFSIIYLLTVISYFRDVPIEFIAFLTFWIIFVTRYIVEPLVLWFSKGWVILFSSGGGTEVLGEAIGCDNPFLYKVEINYFKHKMQETNKGSLVYLSLEQSLGAVGIIIDEKQLLNKKWLTVYLIEKNNTPLRIDLKKNEFVSSSKTIFSRSNAVYSLSLEEIDDCLSKELVEDNYLYKNRDNFIGYTTTDSNINQIRFHSLLDGNDGKAMRLKEGSVIKTEIYGKDVLYQIIDGRTYERQLEKHNLYGYLTGVAQKLGRYIVADEELDVVKWLPNMYAPVFFDDTKTGNHNPAAIGVLPETTLEIVIKDPDALVTHNTAILGILGIGKSCLSYELIQKLIDCTDIHIVCIDITNEYKKDLGEYIDEHLIRSDEEHSFDELNTNFENVHYDRNSNNQNVANHEKSGNRSDYRKVIQSDLMTFFFECDSVPEDKRFKYSERLRVYNPDYHKVSKGEKVGFNAITTELTQAEKTRIICEEIFRILMKVGLRVDQKARVAVIFEEAHSLVPEWSSTANDGDNTAVNGTAKVVLQGRKYGLGSIVVTQRTANISKSILNQCNTIFALRVFDDTGKQFLENYIGSDYSNTLPTLEERHAIAVGKALKLKQPVIVTLNDMKDIRRTVSEVKKE